MRVSLLAAALLALVPPPAISQQFPSKTVRMVNPFPPGGPLDLIGRTLSERLSALLGQPVIVENKPGAAGNIGAGEVARAPADGHTLLLTLFSIVTSNPHLYDGIGFDPLKDFAPVSAIAGSDSVLIAHPSVPAGSIAELIAYAKANPGKLNYASAGKASPGHLTSEYFGRRAGVQLTHVPYKGNAEAVRSVLAGETQIMFTPSTVTLPHVKSGKLKAIAVYLTDQIDELPGIRSMAAQGMDGFDAKSLPFWYGLLAPAGTPKAAIGRVHADLVKVLKEEKVASALKSARIFVIGNSPEEFGAMIGAGHAAWGRVIRETGVRGE